MRTSRRGWLGWLVPIALIMSQLPACARAPTPETEIALTFDDGLAEDPQFAAMLEARGLRGTFFIISGSLGHEGYMSVAQVHGLAAAGHEIGGHTVSHPYLTTLSPDEVQRQICNDRANLASYGFETRSFAYPYGDANPDVEAAAAACGYNSARGVGPIGDPGVPPAEALTPADRYYLRTPAAVENTTTLAEIEGRVEAAEKAGGVLELVFHNLCDGTRPCPRFGVSTDDFSALLDWLVARGAKTVLARELVDRPVAPLAAVPNPVENPSLENGDGGAPPGWVRGGSGQNTPVWSTTSDAHTGLSAQQVNVSAYVSGSALLAPSHVFALPGSAGHTFEISAWYKSTGQPLWTIYTRSDSGASKWWIEGPKLSSAATWTQTTFTTPALPAGATGLSFGLALSANGSLIVDDFALKDLGASSAPP
jgi:peptidoglycan/xylan/chitin deacetylase (PgdA/CDA1 family)